MFDSFWVLFSEDELKIIRTHCSSLKHIDMGFVLTEDVNVAEFIASYGDQLDYVYEMTENELNHVVGTSGNA